MVKISSSLYLLMFQVAEISKKYWFASILIENVYQQSSNVLFHGLYTIHVRKLLSGVAFKELLPIYVYILSKTLLYMASWLYKVHIAIKKNGLTMGLRNMTLVLLRLLSHYMPALLSLETKLQLL